MQNAIDPHLNMQMWAGSHATIPHQSDRFPLPDDGPLLRKNLGAMAIGRFQAVLMCQRDIISVAFGIADFFYRAIKRRRYPCAHGSGNIHAAVKAQLFGDRMDSIPIR